MLFKLTHSLTSSRVPSTWRSPRVNACAEQLWPLVTQGHQLQAVGCHTQTCSLLAPRRPLMTDWSLCRPASCWPGLSAIWVLLFHPLCSTPNSAPCSIPSGTQCDVWKNV